MNKNKSIRYSMSDEELKALRKSLESVKKLDFFNKNKEQSNKTRKLKKVA